MDAFVQLKRQGKRWQWRIRQQISGGLQVEPAPVSGGLQVADAPKPARRSGTPRSARALTWSGCDWTSRTSVALRSVLLRRLNRLHGTFRRWTIHWQILDPPEIKRTLDSVG